MSPKRYESNLDDDGKSGYRPAVGPDKTGRIPMSEAEAWVQDLLAETGGKPLEKLCRLAFAAGYMPEETTRAVLRLCLSGLADYDLTNDVVTVRPPVKPLPFWWRPLQIGAIHPAWVLIFCVLMTVGGCRLWVMNAHAELPPANGYPTR